jgi:hypothetical protein
MSWLIKAQREDFLGLFDEPARKVVRRDLPQSEPFQLTLYRGFSGNLDEVHRDSAGRLILSPRKSEQGMIWFTHQFIRGYDPIEYAKSHGDYLLIYPLSVIRHFITIHYDDGSTYRDIPPEILERSIPTENCRFHAGIELPEGWVFSYKHEKFIGCTMELPVTEDMIQEVTDEMVA